MPRPNKMPRSFDGPWASRVCVLGLDCHGNPLHTLTVSYPLTLHNPNIGSHPTPHHQLTPRTHTYISTQYIRIIRTHTLHMPQCDASEFRMIVGSVFWSIWELPGRDTWLCQLINHFFEKVVGDQIVTTCIRYALRDGNSHLPLETTTTMADAKSHNLHPNFHCTGASLV